MGQDSTYLEDQGSSGGVFFQLSSNCFLPLQGRFIDYILHEAFSRKKTSESALQASPLASVAQCGWAAIYTLLYIKRKN